MNNDLISREALLAAICEGCNGAKKKGCGNPCCDYELIETAPAVDAEPVRHGRWIEREDNIGEVYFSCSACSEDWYIPDGTPAENHMFFCPVCGARMDGGADDV